MIDLDARSNISVFDERRLFRSYEVFDYNHPFSVHFESSQEPRYMPTSWHFLQYYQTETLGMKKAKSFWLRTEKYIQNPEAREQIRNQYPEEVATLRRTIRLKHISIRDEAAIASRHPITPHDPTSCIIPDNFVNLEDFFIFEPEERVGLTTREALTHFIGTYKDDDLLWNITVDDLRLIQRDHPDKVEKLKQLLWERHLYRVREGTGRIVRVNNEGSQQEARVLMILITTISAIGATIFAGIAIFTSQPLLFTSSAILLITAIAAPLIYQLRKPLYE
jgi:hypothetical protein